MKILILTFSIILASLPLISQNNLKTFEYWFDSSVNEKTITILDQNSTEYTANLSIETSKLNLGLHVFNYRIADNKGEWSVVNSSFFNKIPEYSNQELTIKGYEYWIDDQVEESTFILTSENSISESLDVNELQNGLHLFNYRILDSKNKWSTVRSQFFIKKQNALNTNSLITKYEYWINENIEDKTSITLDVPVNPYALVTQIETPILPIGSHLFSIRFQDSNGIWSETQSTNFSVTSCYIDKAEKPLGDLISCTSVSENVYTTEAVVKANGYLWKLLPEEAGVISSIDTSALISWNESFIGEVQLFVAATNECGEGENSDTLIIERVANPEKPVIASESFYEFCDTDSIILTAPEGFTYLWQDYSENQTFVAKNSGECYVRIMNEAGCFTQSDTVKIETHETPNIPSIMAYGDTQFCEGDSVEIGVNNLPKDSFYHYWTTGETTETIWAKQSGEYAHKLISDFGCESDYSDTIAITVYENPDIPTITQNENTLSASEAYAYQWYQDLTPVAGLVAIDNAIEQNFTPQEDGTYAVEVFNENNCSNFSEPFDFIGIGIKSQVENFIEIYPNPNNGEFVINLSQNCNNGTVTITNLSGKVILSKQIYNTTNLLGLNLNTGVYLVKFVNSNYFSTTKLHIN